ncbi:sodium:calcium antiporter [Natronomonas marina]|uniref:sodium:calcium antiporter n=1 Tax=Natronomonas marina TaxID=2961939 RepID=UPI0020C9AC38|nr:hypothetical protein [Natronomonas marina]
MPVPSGLLAQISVGAVALYALVTAASRAIDRLLALAEYYDIDEVLIGVTVLAVGTSLPELSSHLVASLGILSGTLDYRVTSAVVIGGNTGSSTIQQFLLVGVFLVGYGSIRIDRTFVRDSYVPMLATFLVTLVVAWDGSISRLDGAVLFALYLGYVGLRVSRRRQPPSLREPPSRNPRHDAAVAAGLLVVVFLAATLVLSVVEVIVAALPELTAVIDAIRRRAPNVALGTLVGSNIVNPLVGIGLGGAVSTYYVPPAVILWDLPFKLLAGAGLLGWTLYYRDGELGRREGAYLLGLYFVFVTGRLLLFPGQ